MKRKLRVLKAKGGADAAKDDFKTPSSMSAVTKGNPFSAGNQGATNTSSSINNTNNTTNNTTNNATQKSRNIPIIGPVTLGINVLQKLIKPKTAKHPFSANTIKQTKTKPPMGGGGGEGPQLCPDGTMPPCKTTGVVKPNAPNKSNFFGDFKAYNKGGGVPYGPPPLRGPNPQVPPVKFSRGGGAAIRGLKFKGVF